MQLSGITAFDSTAIVARDGTFRNLSFDLLRPSREMLTFCGNATFLRSAAESSHLTAIITTEEAYKDYSDSFGEIKDKGVAFVDSPRRFFFEFHNYLVRETDFYHRDVKKDIGTNCRISRHASVADNVRIGDNVVIEDFVRVCDNVSIGDNTIVRSGAVIGNEGFQMLDYYPEVLAVLHAGGVSIGRDVEIQAAACIDRHIFREDTIVGDGTKVDSFVHIAHAACIGQNCRIASRATVAGSTHVGDGVWIGPSATISSSLSIGDRANISIGSVVTRNLKKGEHVTGNFAVPHQKFLLRYIKEQS